MMALHGRYPRQKLLLLGLLTLVILGVLGIGASRLAAWDSGQSYQTPQEQGQTQKAMTYVISQLSREQSLVTVFDPTSKKVLTKFTTRDDNQPVLAVSPEGSRLFLIETSWSADFHTRTDTLSLIDTATWATTRQITMPQDYDQIPTAVVSPDGSRLLVEKIKGHLADNVGDYWLSVIDAASLETLPVKVELLGCGVALLGTTPKHVVALCLESRQVYFVDAATASIVATVNLSPVSLTGSDKAGFVTSRDGQFVYVVTDDLKIIEIDTASYTISGQIWGYKRPPGTVYAVRLSRQTNRLIVGAYTQPFAQRATDESFSLQVITLPSFDHVQSISFPGLVKFAPAPGDGLYLHETPGQNQSTLEWIGFEGGPTQKILEVEGDITCIVAYEPGIGANNSDCY